MKKAALILILLLLLAGCTKAVATKTGIVIGTEKEIEQNNITGTELNSTSVSGIEQTIASYDTPDVVINDVIKEMSAVDFGNVVSP